MGETQLGRMQFRIMQVLWDRGRASARDVTDALNERTEPVAHSTVQTLLRQLEAKGAVGHEADGRTFVFFASSRKTGSNERPRATCWNGSSGAMWGAWSPICIKDERLSRTELDQLRRMLDERRKD